MSDPEAPPRSNVPRDFREAFAQWRLSAHTEIKRSSSLPTAMFDAIDPTLEMQLADSTAEMLACLGRPREHLTRRAEEQDGRLEYVDPEELRRVAARITEQPEERIDLLEELDREFLAVLAEACHAGATNVRRRAAAQLCEVFGITLDNLGEVVADLQRIAEGSRFRRAPEECRAVIASVERELRAALPAGAAPDAELRP